MDSAVVGRGVAEPERPLPQAHVVGSSPQGAVAPAADPLVQAQHRAVAYPPDRGMWDGQPGPPWPPGEGEPLRILFEMSSEGGEAHVDLAKSLAERVPKGAVAWQFVTQHSEGARRYDEPLAPYGERRLLLPGSGDRMFWQFLRIVLDTRPHLVHTCTWRGVEWAQKCGLPWVRVTEEGTESAWPVEWQAEDPLRGYRALVAEPVDIIMVAVGQVCVTQTCLSAILAHTWWPYRLILVNNGSDDQGATAALFERVQALLGRDRCEVVTSLTNVGCAGGRELAYPHSTADWLFILDNDMLVGPGWLGRLMALGLNEPRAGAVSPWSEVYPRALCGMPAREQNGAMRAANNLYRRAAVTAAEEVPGELYCEPFRSAQGRSDTDLNYRIIEAGYDLYFDGQVIFHHLGGALFRLPGMTRRFADGQRMKDMEGVMADKWLAAGVRRSPGEPDAEGREVISNA